MFLGTVGRHVVYYRKSVINIGKESPIAYIIMLIREYMRSN